MFFAVNTVWCQLQFNIYKLQQGRHFIYQQIQLTKQNTTKNQSIQGIL